MKRELPHVRTNAFLDDRLVSADSCDPLPRVLEITEQVDDNFGAVLNSKKSSWTSTKLPSRGRKLCELTDYTRSLVYLGVDVLIRGAPWCEPRVRMRKRVRAVGVRSEVIRVLPPSQRGILVADAVASLWMAGGGRQLKPMSSKLAGALRGSVAKRYGTRAGVAEHLFGPGVHRTFPPAAYIYTFCLQFTRMVSMGRLGDGRIVHSVWVACMEWWRPAGQFAVDWCAPCELSAGGATFNFSSVGGPNSVPFEVGEFKHATSERASRMSNLRSFLRLAVSRFMALVRPRDYGSVTGGKVD